MQNFPKLVILSHAGMLVQIPTIAWYFFLSYHSLDISYAFKGEVQSSISHLNKNLTLIFIEYYAATGHVVKFFIFIAYYYDFAKGIIKD